MATERCPRCKQYLYEWKLPHTCPPRWEVVLADHQEEDEPAVFHSDGFDERSVAESYAAHVHSDCDYPNSMEVWVRKNDGCEWKKFTIDVEMVPSFTASEVFVAGAQP